METNSFGEDLVVKSRKPYTITKQREKWTEEEHGRFLEALKLYGRAWQRIEEHIGTKTAIQIRSHAQKFFTKLEKEAAATGTPLGQAHDIDIPPPRPKKKPNYPYPRKTGFCSIPPTETADEKTSKTINPLSQEINKQEASVAAKQLQQTKECSDDAHCSVVLNLFQDAPSASIPSRDKGSKNQLSFREYVPTVKVDMESTLSGMTKSNQDLGRTSGVSMELHALSASSGEGETFGAHKQPKKQSETNRDQGVQYHVGNEAEEMQAACVDGSNLKATVENGDSPSSASSLMNHTIPAAPASHTCSAMSYISHPYPTFPPFAQLRTTQDFYRSFLGISSACSSQIVSTLLQNPAVHAAACMAAASLWPSEEMDSSSTAAIVSATVAAASAWWTTNGFIPFFSPLHAPGFAFSPPATSFPVANTGQAPQEKTEERHETYQNSSSADQQAVLLSSSSSSSNLKKIENTNFSNFKPLSDVAHHNLDGAKISKHERSSCGSNTTSSSEIERHAVLKKNGSKTKDEIQQIHFQNLPAGEVNTRRARSSFCFNEAWKEVSQEGRLAFQALFARDILPQSFATRLEKPEMGLLKEDEIKHGNLKVRRTGFKPYKRCSAEVEVHKSSANDENCNKKIRLEGEI